MTKGKLFTIANKPAAVNVNMSFYILDNQLLILQLYMLPVIKGAICNNCPP